MTKHLKTLFISAALILPLCTSAKESNAPKVTTSTAIKNLDPAYIDATEKFFKAMHLEGNYAKMIDSSTEMLIRTNPALANVKKDIRAFYEKYIGWKSIKNDMMLLYAKYYTISELEDIATFYQTDTGQKTLKLLPVIYKEGQELGVKLVTDHMDELKEIIEKSMETSVKKMDK